MKEFLTAMEDAGEIITFMAHKVDGNSLKSVEKVVFVMDEIKGNKKRKVSKVAWLGACHVR